MLKIGVLRLSINVNSVCHGFSKLVTMILEKAFQETVQQQKLAENAAMESFTRVKAFAIHLLLQNKAYFLDLVLYWSGIILKICVRLLARTYFRERSKGRI